MMRILLFLFALLLPALAQAADLPRVIRIGASGAGYGKSTGIGLIGVTATRRYLEEEFAADGIKVEWTFFSGSGPAINEAFANNQLDFAAYGALPTILGKARGIKTRLIASAGWNNVYVVARKGIQASSIKELKGLRVAFARGTFMQTSIDALLAQNGMSERDLAVVDIKTDQIALLVSGAADAVVGSSTLLAAVKDGGGNLVYTTRDQPNGKAVHFGGVVVSEAFAQAYPQLVNRFARAYVRAAHWASLPQNRDAVLDIAVQGGIDPDIVRSDNSGHTTLSSRYNPLLDPFFLNWYRDAIAFNLENRLIRSNINLDEWVDRRPLESAVKELGVETFWRKRDANGVE